MEKELLRRLLAHEKTAANEFYRTYSPRLLAFIRRKVNDEKDVEEIAQDALFAFLDGIRDFSGKCSLNTYLCSIAYNKVIDFYRKKKFKKIVFSQMPEGIEPVISELLDPQKMLDNTFLAEKIKRIFSFLTPHYARMLKLKYVEGRSVEEAARVLSISFKSAESILFRARRAFIRAYHTTT